MGLDGEKVRRRRPLSSDSMIRVPKMRMDYTLVLKTCQMSKKTQKFCFSQVVGLDVKSIKIFRFDMSLEPMWVHLWGIGSGEVILHGSQYVTIKRSQIQWLAMEHFLLNTQGWVGLVAVKGVVNPSQPPLKPPEPRSPPSMDQGPPLSSIFQFFDFPHFPSMQLTSPSFYFPGFDFPHCPSSYSPSCQESIRSCRCQYWGYVGPIPKAAH